MNVYSIEQNKIWQYNLFGTKIRQVDVAELNCTQTSDLKDRDFFTIIDGNIVDITRYGSIVHHIANDEIGISSRGTYIPPLKLSSEKVNIGTDDIKVDEVVLSSATNDISVSQEGELVWRL